MRSNSKTLAKDAKGRLRTERVDIADTDGVAALRATISDEKLDLLFVVAGVSGSVSDAVA